MSIKSPLEDFLKTTLAAVEGCWQKLAYMARLRTDAAQSEYGHWGLSRRHGRTESDSAIGEAHSQVFLEVLRMPLRELLQDIHASASPLSISPRDYVEQLKADLPDMVPTDLKGGSSKHLEVTLKAMESLTRDQKRGTGPTE